MALNSLIPVMTEGFGMGQPVSAVLPRIPLLLPTTKHVHVVVRTLSRRQTRGGKISVGVSSEEAVSTDPDVSGKETHEVKGTKRLNDKHSCCGHI